MLKMNISKEKIRHWIDVMEKDVEDIKNTYPLAAKHRVKRYAGAVTMLYWLDFITEKEWNKTTDEIYNILNGRHDDAND